MILCSQTREFSLKWGVKKFYDILVFCNACLKPDFVKVKKEDL